MFLRLSSVFFMVVVSQVISANYAIDNAITKRSHHSSLIAPESCKDVVSESPRTVVVLASGLKVMCDTTTDGGGWTVIQRRFDGHLDFYRGWEEYKTGFGDLHKGEFYLGNEKIHQLTTKRHELRVDIKYKGKSYFAKYARFRVYSEHEYYKLKVNGYSGNAGDALSKLHNNQKFSTFDRDHDIKGYGQCARSYHGGWWYSDCHAANLNGLWGSVESGKGLTWFPKTGYHRSVTFTEMKIRQI